MPRVLTPKIRAKIVELATAGSPVHDIWVQINREVSKGYISVVISNARKDGVAIPHRRKGAVSRRKCDRYNGIFTFAVAGKVADALRAAALRRNVNVQTLTGDLLITIVNDGIIDAVLDDA